MNAYLLPNWEHSALLTIDTQNDFSLPGAPAEVQGTLQVLPNMVKLLHAYRKHQWPIIHVIRLYRKDGSNVDLCRREMIEAGKRIVLPHSGGAELVEAIKPPESPEINADELLSGGFQQIGTNEWVMYKPRWGAFYQTDLESFARKRQLDTLVFCGCNFPNCPRASIYEASERDFRTVLAADAVSGVYEKGLEELRAIGVQVLDTERLLIELT